MVAPRALVFRPLVKGNVDSGNEIGLFLDWTLEANSIAGDIRGAIHLTKISGNSGTKSNGTERFWKFVSKIVDNLRRLSFFLEIWKFRKFPVPFGISTRFESTPVPLVVKSYKMAASKSVESTLHWMQNDLPRLEPVLDRKRKR